MAAPMSRGFRSFFNPRMLSFQTLNRLTTFNRQPTVLQVTGYRCLFGISSCHNTKPCDNACGLVVGQSVLRSSAPPSPSAFNLLPLSVRFLSSVADLDDATVKSKIEGIADKFMEARELLEDAREVKGTVYFSEDMKEAAEAVDETLKEYNDFLAQLNDKQRQEVLRTIGLKMEELKAHKEMLVEELLEDE